MNELIFNSSVIVKICLFAIAALAIGLVAALIKISKLSRKNDDILELADTMRAELTQRRERIEKLTVEVAELKMRKVIDDEQSDEEGSDETVGEDADAAADAAEGEASDAGDDSSDPKVILIAEDNAQLCEAAANMLREAGFIAEIADNGKTAFEKFSDSEEGFYSLILMDVRMPKMNGAEAAALIRASQRTDAKSVPIVAMTANAFGDDLTSIEEAGMNGHVSKPLDALGLIAAVREYIGKASQKAETADDERGSKIVNLRAV